MRAILAAHGAELQRYASRLTGNREDAEDLYQDTTLRLWKSLDDLRDDTAARKWMHTTMRNAWINIIRRRARHRLGSAEFATVTEHETPAMHPVTRALGGLVASLRAPQQAAILARAQGIQPKHAKDLFLARKGLRERLTDEAA